MQRIYVKYLRILIDKNFSWIEHIHLVPLKISKTMEIIARLRHFVPFRTLSQIYQSLIYPCLSYGLSSCGQATKVR